MYYEEKTIAGELYCRSNPNSDWRPLNKESLTILLNASRGYVQRLKRQISVIEQKLLDLGDN